MITSVLPRHIWRTVVVSLVVLASLGIMIGWGVGLAAVKVFDLAHLDHFSRDLTGAQHGPTSPGSN